MRILAVLFFVFASLFCFAQNAPAQVAGEGANCAAWEHVPQGVMGNGSCPAPSWFYSPEPTPAANLTSTWMAPHLAHRLLEPDPYTSSNGLLILCTGTTATLTAVPFNFATGTTGTIGTAIPFTNMATNAHDCNGGVYLGHAPGFTTNYFLVGGASYNSPTLNCDTATGGPGTALGCQQWGLGSGVTSGCTGAAFVDICAAGSVVVSPMLGVSEFEGSCSANYLDCYACGQMQHNSGLAVNADVVCSHFQPVWNTSTGALSALNVDTAAATGNPASACCTAWNFMGGTSVTNNANPGSFELFAHPRDDSVVYSSFPASDGATGTSTWNVTLPSLGTYTQTTFTWTGGSGTGTTDAASAAAAFNTGSNTRTANYIAIVAGYGAAGECPGPANACVIIYAKTGDPASLAFTGCSVTVTGYTTAPTSVCLAGNNNSGLFSMGTHCLGPQWLRDYTPQGGHFYESCLNTNSYGPDTTGGGQDQIMLHAFIVCWSPAVNGITTIYGPSCGMNGYAGVKTSPAGLCNSCSSTDGHTGEYLHIVGGGPPPPTQCSPSDCSRTILEYIGTTATAIDFFVKNPPTANQAAGWNPFSFSFSQTTLPGGSGNNNNGNANVMANRTGPASVAPYFLPSYDFALGKPVLDVVYAGYSGSATNYEIVYLEVDQTTGNTLSSAFVESGNATTATIAPTLVEKGLMPVIYWNAGTAAFANGCSTSGGCLYKYTTANRSTFTRSFVLGVGGGNNGASYGEDQSGDLDTCMLWHLMNASTTPPATGSWGLKIFQTVDC